MPPNNEVANTTERSSNVNDNREGRTTILTKGTVESRGNGTVNSDEVVSSEIQEFINGEGKCSFWTEVRAFFTVWIFVTRLPAPSWVDAHPGYMMRGLTYFPVTGILIGLLVSSFYDLASFTLSLPLIIASIISEVASLWVTGCFHEDGLADSADGIGGGWTTEQILKIMTDTRLGTYGCAILLLYMQGKVELISALGKSVWEFGNCHGGGPAIIVTQSLARLVAPIMVRTRDYVDEGGPKYRFYSFFLSAKYLVTWYRVVFATVISFLVATIAYGVVKGAVLIFVVVVVAFFSGRYADYLLGGVMGDYLGATICVTEMCLLTTILLFDILDQHLVVIDELTSILTETTAGNMSFSNLIEAITGSDAMLSLIKFGVVILFMHVWCSNVGHQDVFVRQTEKKPSDKNQ